MEVASQRQLDFDLMLQFVERVLMTRAVIGKLVIRVRRGYHLSNAVAGRHGTHFVGHRPRARAIVSVRQNVRVNINHGSIVTTTNTAAGRRTMLVIAGASDNGNTSDMAADSDSRLIVAFLDYLKVEKGLAPLTVAAYTRDLAQFQS